MIRNLTEDRVTEAYRRLSAHFPSFCGCDSCRNDVLIFALNRLPPRYVASDEGKAVTEFQLEKGQNRADIDRTLIDGFKTVAMAPRCGKVKPQTL
ncbi:MAG: competence protein ComFB [Gemmatimonadales bacterium]|jgi:competence protein ComFB|nr:MAG: competence protein ComFB [Gemmatimonadales bacterium]